MSLAKVCPECGMPLDLGLAKCPHCDAQVGTVFSENDPPTLPKANKYQKNILEQSAHYLKLEKAREQANNSVILALASFFCPGFGFVLSIISIFFGVAATRFLKANNIEEGRGAAMAGVIIGSIALLAQTCYMIYAIKMGIPFVG